MNNSSGTLQDSVSLIFFLIIYVPCNVFFMVVVAVLFSVINKVLHLNFPIWILAVAAALLIFVMMATFINGSSGKVTLGNTVNSTLFYSTTLIINLLVVVLMLTLTGINKLIFSTPSSTPFAFEKPQLITTSIYLLITGIFAILPLISAGSDYMDETKKEELEATLKKAMTASTVDEFNDVYDGNSDLLFEKLPGEENSLLDSLVAQDKLAIVRTLADDNEGIAYYSDRLNIKSQAMLQLLLTNGLNPTRAVERLTAYNRTELVKFVVGNYRPKFDFTVSYITQHLMQYKNIDLLDYLIKNGLRNDPEQSRQTIYTFVEKNERESIELLLKKGFAIDTSDNRLITVAAQNNNLRLLETLFRFPFRLSVTDGEYTGLEMAIKNSNDQIFDFLLTQKPDLKTVHQTPHDGRINALSLAEKYQRADMVGRLNRYVAQTQ
ncbi:hypothetical protein [Spirosoma areae]